jgi:biopolymer transport protein ExbB
MNDIHSHQLLILGGPAMIPILISSVVALTIMLSKFNDFRKTRADLPQLKTDVFALVRANKIKAAVILCENNGSALSRVLRSGLLEFGNTRDEIKDAVSTAVSLEITKLERGLTPLITIANVTPLFGILGTVLGMAVIFQTISVRSAGMEPVTVQDLAGGIWQALLTTIAGLVVAIPSFVAYNYFVAEVSQNVNQLEQGGEELVHNLTHLNENYSNPPTDVQE